MQVREKCEFGTASFRRISVLLQIILFFNILSFSQKSVKSEKLNRSFHSQTDLFGTKILTPQIFLENILALCPKAGGSENFPPLDPLGPQNPYLGVRSPKTEKLPIWQGIFFYLLPDHVGQQKTFTQFQKNWIRPFFGPFLTQKHQKRAKFKRGKKEGPLD